MSLPLIVRVMPCRNGSACSVGKAGGGGGGGDKGDGIEGEGGGSLGRGIEGGSGETDDGGNGDAAAEPDVGVDEGRGPNRTVLATSSSLFKIPIRPRSCWFGATISRSSAARSCGASRAQA